MPHRQHQANTWTNVTQVLCRHIASPDDDELICYGLLLDGTRDYPISVSHTLTFISYELTCIDTHVYAYRHVYIYTCMYRHSKKSGNSFRQWGGTFTPLGSNHVIEIHEFTGPGDGDSLSVQTEDNLIHNSVQSLSVAVIRRSSTTSAILNIALQLLR